MSATIDTNDAGGWWHRHFGDAAAAPWTDLARCLMEDESVWPVPSFYAMEASDVVLALQEAAQVEDDSCVSRDAWTRFLTRCGPLEDCLVHAIEGMFEEDTARQTYRALRLPRCSSQKPRPVTTSSTAAFDNALTQQRLVQTKDGLAWWRHSIRARTVPTAAFMATLLQSHRPTTMSPRAVSVFLDILCFGAKDSISLAEWELFLLRFGPFGTAVDRAIACVESRGAVAPWFHGTLTRQQVTALLDDAPDGTFLVRFSQQHADKFTLAYMKAVAGAPRQLKNVLIGYRPLDGYRALDGGSGLAYPSVAALVRDCDRLGTPVTSKLAADANAKLRTVQTTEYNVFGTYCHVPPMMATPMDNAPPSWPQVVRQMEATKESTVGEYSTLSEQHLNQNSGLHGQQR
ncbi:Aste57867_23431 [Aphanomyces stellatus]|uniref:Aste57867_23431 protein n=1 Tax=Aphanomyces stellatus TaxID=120398 RepID=A0A485LMT3_9STRA|nr:hypothetical protein As57867_023360 [Aphanomyces stellatus]VFU00077.1 Aste57867_23431 [Aphanomyces stellatus]